MELRANALRPFRATLVVTMNKLLCFFVVFSVTLSNGVKVVWAENIGGAFGLKFGEKLDAKDQAKCAKNDYCEFSPSNPYHAFNSYFARLSPYKGKIYEIVGLGEPENYSQCLESAREIAKTIENKSALVVMTSNSKNVNVLFVNFINEAVFLRNAF